MKGQTHEEPQILAAAERQMRASALREELDQRSSPTTEKCSGKNRVQPYVAISRESGVDAGQIAEMLGAQLDWPVYDRNLLDEMATQFHLSRPKLEEVDETTTDWVYDNLATCFNRQVVPHERYIACLRRVVTRLTRDTSTVLVGRGVQFLLPEECGLAVRIIAPMKFRLERIMEREGLSRNAAWDRMRKTDAGRRALVRRYFDRDIDDPHLYDLVVNVAYQGYESVAEQIAFAVRRKNLSRLQEVTDAARV